MYVSIVHSFLLLRSIPVYGCITVCLLIVLPPSLLYQSNGHHSPSQSQAGWVEWCLGVTRTKLRYLRKSQKSLETERSFPLSLTGRTFFWPSLKEDNLQSIIQLTEVLNGRQWVPFHLFPKTVRGAGMQAGLCLWESVELRIKYTHSFSFLWPEVNIQQS
jgi:hypothetical protein